MTDQHERIKAWPPCTNLWYLCWDSPAPELPPTGLTQAFVVRVPQFNISLCPSQFPPLPLQGPLLMEPLNSHARWSPFQSQLPRWPDLEQFLSESTLKALLLFEGKVLQSDYRASCLWFQLPLATLKSSISLQGRTKSVVIDGSSSHPYLIKM